VACSPLHATLHIAHWKAGNTIAQAYILYTLSTCQVLCVVSNLARQQQVINPRAKDCGKSKLNAPTITLCHASRTPTDTLVDGLLQYPISKVRFVAVSATIPNVGDIAAWLNVPSVQAAHCGKSICSDEE
jgi:hypothetical protein